MWLHRHFPPKERWDRCVGRSSSIYPNCRIFIENPWRVKPAEKFDKKASLMNSFKIEKSNQPLLMKCIWKVKNLADLPHKLLTFYP